VEFHVLRAVFRADIIAVHIASTLVYRCSGIITLEREFAAVVIMSLLGSKRILLPVETLYRNETRIELLLF